MRKTITALTAALFLVSTSFATNASGGKEDKGKNDKKKNDEYSYNKKHDKKKDDYDFDERDHGHHHGQKFVWQFFKHRPDDLKCRQVVVYVPKWDDHWLASYHDDDRNGHGHDNKGHEHHKKYKKIVGYLCKVPVSKY